MVVELGGLEFQLLGDLGVELQATWLVGFLRWWSASCLRAESVGKICLQVVTTRLGSWSFWRVGSGDGYGLRMIEIWHFAWTSESCSC